MRNLSAGLGAGLACLALAACGGGDDRSSEALPESVEVPAEEALQPITDEPVADPDINQVLTDNGGLASETAIVDEAEADEGPETETEASQNGADGGAEEPADPAQEAGE